mmetsp:Transcript_26191/g.104775  ORF Transcript_26191/g.104775 Transcript_26191/m.104775 type:complete len:222 (-) Transcript_26191:210-875(-)
MTKNTKTDIIRRSRDGRDEKRRRDHNAEQRSNSRVEDRGGLVAARRLGQNDRRRHGRRQTRHGLEPLEEPRVPRHDGRRRGAERARSERLERRDRHHVAQCGRAAQRQTLHEAVQPRVAHRADEMPRLERGAREQEDGADGAVLDGELGPERAAAAADPGGASREGNGTADGREEPVLAERVPREREPRPRRVDERPPPAQAAPRPPRVGFLGRRSPQSWC